MAQEKNISKFIEAINLEAQQRRAKINEETQRHIKQVIKETTSRTREEGKAITLKRIAVIHDDIGRDYSEKIQKSKREIISRRDEIVNIVFANAEKMIIEFTETPQYLDLLLKSASEVREQARNVKKVFIRKQDMKYANEILKITGGIAEESYDIRLGGLRFEINDGSAIADDTLESRLLGCAEWFKESCGLKI